MCPYVKVQSDNNITMDNKSFEYVMPFKGSSKANLHKNKEQSKFTKK